MKNIMIILLLLAVSVSSFCQKTTVMPAKDPGAYTGKSKRLQTAATVLLLASPVLIVAPLLIGSGIKNGGDATAGIVYGTIAAGFLAFPVSIGLFIASSASHKRALRLSFKNEKVHYLTKQRFINQSIPSLSLKINL
jgi:hypothetical protein